MTTYTGVADANGDFTVPFSSNYTSGQKITVTAEKDSAVKTIELYAPSNLTGGGGVQFSGTMNNFPNNIGVITLSDQISGVISNYAMKATTDVGNIFRAATGLIINGAVTSIGSYTFQDWVNATSLILPASLVTINQNAFISWGKALNITIPDSVQTIAAGAFYGWVAATSVTIGSGVTSIGAQAFMNLTACSILTIRAVNPPVLANVNVFSGLKSTCVIQVPTASLSAYQAAANWSTYASKMVGV